MKLAAYEVKLRHLIISFSCLLSFDEEKAKELTDVSFFSIRAISEAKAFALARINGFQILLKENILLDLMKDLT